MVEVVAVDVGEVVALVVVPVVVWLVVCIVVVVVDANVLVFDVLDVRVVVVLVVVVHASHSEGQESASCRPTIGFEHSDLENKPQLKGSGDPLQSTVVVVVADVLVADVLVFVSVAVTVVRVEIE